MPAPARAGQAGTWESGLGELGLHETPSHFSASTLAFPLFPPPRCGSLMGPPGRPESSSGDRFQCAREGVGDRDGRQGPRPLGRGQRGVEQPQMLSPPAGDGTLHKALRSILPIVMRGAGTGPHALVAMPFPS